MTQGTESAHSTMQPPLHARPTHANGDCRETRSSYSPMPHKLGTKTEIEVSEVSSATVCTLSILKIGLCMARWRKHKQLFYSLLSHIHSFDHLSSRKNCTPNSEFTGETNEPGQWAILAPLLPILTLTLKESEICHSFTCKWTFQPLILHPALLWAHHSPSTSWTRGTPAPGGTRVARSQSTDRSDYAAGPGHAPQRHVSGLLFQVRNKGCPRFAPLTHTLKQMGRITLKDCQRHTMKMKQELVSPSLTQ